METAAIILAGGRGKRMGMDKATLVFQGKPLLLRQIEALQSTGFQEVVVALGKRRALPFELKVPVVEDVFPDRGPLAGIHAGLSTIRAPLALVLACDMPFFVAPLIHKLLELSQAEKIAVCVRNGLIEPFPGIYPKRLLPLLNRVLASENLGVQEFIRFAPHSFLPEDKVQELDPNGLSFVNLNSKEEVKERLCGR
jgi:molybdopterin-guanine dinucleotide biosynthesis protein A